MKITCALVGNLLTLRAGGSVPASALRGRWVDELLREGVLVSSSHRSRTVIRAANPSTLEQAIATVDERLGNLDTMAEILTDDGTTRADMATYTGNSKLVTVRSCPGFMLNSYEPIQCTLCDEPFTVNPPDGACLFISDWQHFTPMPDTIIVGIENMENFLQIRRQRQLFESEITAEAPLLFAARYPQSTDLRRWLQRIPNRYVHFGDFDLAGVAIFQREFRRYLSGRSSFLIPSDIADRLARGSHERYLNQYIRFNNLTTDDPPLDHLLTLIHHHARAYDQEGYIQ